MGNLLVSLSGAEAWAYVVETGGGVRLATDDWERLRLGEGQRVPVGSAGREDVWLFVAAVTPLPPIVWVTMVRRVRAAG